MTAKKRLIRNIIIAVVALALLGGAYIFVSNWEPTKEETVEETPTETIYVVNEDEKDITHIQVKNERGEYILSREENEGTNTYDISPLDANDKNMAAISSTFKSLIKIFGMREISSDKAEDFGFNESNVSYTINKAGGEKIEIVFGDAVPSGGEYYCLNKNDNKIYTVSDSTYKLVTQPIEYYRIKSVLAISDISSISNFELYKDGQLFIKLRHTTEEENSTKIMPTGWTMENPWYAELADDRTSELLTSLATIYGTGFSEDSHSYKYKLNITSGDKTYSFEIADGDDEAYVKNLEKGTVYTVDKEVFEILEAVDPARYISKFVNLINIEKVSKLSVKCEEKEYTMEVGKDGAGYKINGGDIDEKEFKKKYQEIIGLSFIEYIDDTPKGTPYMTIDFNMTDGETLATSIYDYTEREYMAVCPNGSTVKLLKSELEKIKNLM